MMGTLKRIIRRDAGFTLTELAVAMLVVGILAAIAIPSFLGVRNNAYDRDAQASVDAALTAASQHYLNNGDFTNSATDVCNDPTDGSAVLAADLTRIDPNFDFVDGETNAVASRTVSIQAAVTFNIEDESLGCQAFYAAALSRSGTCWVGRLTVEGSQLREDGSGGTDTLVVVNTGDANTDNQAFGTDNLAVNGRAYAGLISVSPTADATTGDNTLVVTADLCNADAQAVLTAADKADGADPTDYYESWRTAVLSSSEDPSS